MLKKFFLLKNFQKNFLIQNDKKKINKILKQILNENIEAIKSLSSVYKNSYKKEQLTRYKKNFLHYRLIGMGGSILGAKATYTIERLVEKAAMELGMDKTEIRMKNFPTQFPFKQTLVHTVDSGDYVAGLEKAKQMADYSGFEARRKKSEANGKLRGIGVSSYFEACGIAPSAAVMSLGCGVGLWESAEVRFNPTGQISVFTGAHSHGQSHDTTFAQIAASGCS